MVKSKRHKKQQNFFRMKYLCVEIKQESCAPTGKLCPQESKVQGKLRLLGLFVCSCALQRRVLPSEASFALMSELSPKGKLSQQEQT